MHDGLEAWAYITIVLLRITPRARLIIAITSIPFIMASIKGTFQGIIWDIMNMALKPGKALIPFVKDVIHFISSIMTLLTFICVMAAVAYASMSLPQYLSLNRDLHRAFSLLLMDKKAVYYTAVLHALLIVTYSHMLGVSMGIVLSLMAFKILSSFGILGICIFGPSPISIFKESLPIQAVLTTVYTAETALWLHKHAPIP